MPESRSTDSEVVLDGQRLTVDDVVRAAREPAIPVRISESAHKGLHASRDLKRDLIATGQPIYGVTTGFGDSANRQISPTKTADLQRNLIRQLLNGTGPAAPSDVVRATMVIRANCLARGNSAVNPALVGRLLELVNHDVRPIVPERGSVGASGDLVPLGYLAATLMAETDVMFRGARVPAADVLAELKLEPIELEAKDGLALVNGTSFSAAFAALAIADAAELATLAEIGTALTSEALLGNRGHFGAFIHQHKPHPGQVTSAAHIADLLADSNLSLDHEQVLDLNDPLADRGYQVLRRSVQDRYSIRCAPHVIGVLRDTIEWARKWVEIEVNSSNDNPLFDVEHGTVHSGGNFYGGHLAQAMDSLRTAVANVADLLDRQVELLVDEKFNNGLTPNLIAAQSADDEHAGLRHGFKGMQIACSAVTAEALGATMPASVFSRSTEAHNQDKVSMSPIAARATRRVVELVREVTAIHLLAACQAVELRGADRMSTRTRRMFDRVRAVSPFVADDQRLDRDIERILAEIQSGSLTNAFEPVTLHGEGV